ncbi:PilN domain-containing protein [Patescibacteria group bacterium]|nr:PilN domain-containing protein [Patescibacteria group bacterium]
MPNLLLEKDKKEIFKEFVLRLVIVFLVFVFITICFAMMMLIPSYARTLSREVTISDEIKIFEQTIDFRKQDSPADILNNENLKIEKIKNTKDFYLTSLISEIVEVKPQGVKIEGFFYEAGNEDGGSLIIRGESGNRNLLVNFVENLERKDIFSQVDFPVSNLVKGESVDFSVKIYIK